MLLVHKHLMLCTDFPAGAHTQTYKHKELMHFKDVSCVWLRVYLCAGNVIKSHTLSPQDEPQKQEDPAKSPQPKEEGSMNILNSHSPKQENNRPTSVVHDQAHTPNNTEENAEVNMLQNNLV